MVGGGGTIILIYKGMSKNWRGHNVNYIYKGMPKYWFGYVCGWVDGWRWEGPPIQAIENWLKINIICCAFMGVY